MSNRKAKVLIVEDSAEAIYGYERNLQDKYREDFDIAFVDSLITLDEMLYDDEGYKEYDAVAIDLNLEMPQYTYDDLEDDIPEFGDAVAAGEKLPTELHGEIPLYGFDYFRLVIMARAETQKMVEEGRIILLSGHAAKLVKEKLFPLEARNCDTVTLIDRADNSVENLRLKIMELANKR